jgi:hypothetical protein
MYIYYIYICIERERKYVYLGSSTNKLQQPATRWAPPLGTGATARGDAIALRQRQHAIQRAPRRGQLAVDGTDVAASATKANKNMEVSWNGVPQ